MIWDTLARGSLQFWVRVRFPQRQEPRSLPQVLSWKAKLPLQTIMRLLQVLVPQVEKIDLH